MSADLTLASAADGSRRLAVRISPTIEREFRRREVFPELRLEAAVRVVNGATGIYETSVERAAEIAEDAKAMTARARELPRGIPVAYGALLRNVEALLAEEARRGLWDDPGFIEMSHRLLDSPARLEIGERVFCFFDGDESGVLSVIVAGYGLHCVSSSAGPYVQKGGQRVNYAYGYVVEIVGERGTFLCRPYQLTREDCEPSHIRLVTARPKHSAAEGVAPSPH